MHDEWPIVCRMTLPMNPVTKKNNMIPVRVGKRTVMIQPKAYRTYEQRCIDLRDNVLTERNDEYRLPINYPVNIEAHYYRANLIDIDKTNLESAMCDVLCAMNFLVDDNCCVATLFDGSMVHLDRGEPRTEITIRAIPKALWPDHITKRKKPKEMKSKYKHVEWDVNEAGVCIPSTKKQTVKTKPKNRPAKKQYRGLNDL